MAMESLPPIPTPAGQRWREFRIRILPIFVFIGAVVTLGVLWKGYVQPGGVVGTVESVTTAVTSIADGQLIDLTVDKFDNVKKDQIIGTASRMDTELVSATLASISADLQVMRARMMMDEGKFEQSAQKLRLDILTERVQLAGEKVNLLQASNEFRRVSELYNQQTPLETATVFELARARRDSLQAQIDERVSLIKEMEDSYATIKPNDSSTSKGKDPISLALQAKELEFQLAVKPLPLKAPIDGIITMVNKRVGERVLKGDIIVTVSAPKTQRIVAYIRQPVNYVPSTNDTVVIRSRNLKRTMGTGQILRVGAQLVSIDPMLLSPDGKRLEVGLPILVSFPAEMNLTPGEYVDMAIQPKGKG
jgi:multidrug resistance efflux pump